jgi:hypothetical protein
VSGPLGTRTFKGTSYNVYQIEWSAGQVWANGPSGQVPGQQKFHIGATFSSVSKTESDSIIITDVTLFDTSGKPLPQHPRWMSFDAATFDQQSGMLNLLVHNVADRTLILRDLVVRDMPRIVSIEAMIADEPISDIDGRIFQPWAGGTRRPVTWLSVEPGQNISVPIANARKRPYVLRRPTTRDCAPRSNEPDPELQCRPGKVVTDLFPATTTYITATIVDQKGQRWDPKAKRLVIGPVETRIYYQLAGRRIPLEARLPRTR